MTQLIPGATLRPEKQDLQLLSSELASMVRDMEDDHAPLHRALPIWWRNYEAESRSATKDRPFKGASNVVIPLIKSMADALQSRSMANLFGAGRRIWGVSSENEDPAAQSLANNLARRINWSAWGNEFNFLALMNDSLGELYPIGSEVTAINYRRNIKPMFFGRGSQKIVPEHAMVEVSRGVQFEHIPRESIMWDHRFEIGEAPLVVREHLYSWSMLKQMAALDPAWDKEVIEKLKGHMDFENKLSDEVRQAKNRLDQRSGDPFGSHADPLKVLEIHIDWPVLGAAGFQKPGNEDMGAPNLPLVIHYHCASGLIPRIVAEPYHLPHKPFFDLYFRKRSGRGHSIGVAKVLEQMQSIMTTLYNQSIDSRTRANAMWGITTNAALSRKPIDPARWMLVNHIDEAKPFTLQTSEFSDLGLMNAANTIAERVIGISDPAQGRETRHGGHPSPATSTLALLEQSNIMSSSTDMMLRERVSKMGQAWAILTQQYETNEDGRLQRVFGAQDAEQMEAWLFPQGPIPGNFHFDIVAMSASLNPDTEMRRAVTVGQMNANYWAFVLQGAQVMESPQVGPLVKQFWTQAIQSTTKVYQKFLNASNVDDMEAFSAQLQDLGQTAAGELGRFAGAAGNLPANAGPAQAAGLNGGSQAGVPAGPGGAGPNLGLLG